MLRIKFLIICFLHTVFVVAQVRMEIKIPDILGYKTLKCDFHMHTVFSDGDVWPTTRVQEAWEDGLDVIAITDNVDYRPHLQDITASHNRPFEIAEPLANRMGITLIRGVEIARGMPPGNLNIIFLKNANLLERESWWDACVEAQAQGAFVFWSHAGEEGQHPDGIKWWPEHTNMTNAEILKGIEAFNFKNFYKETLKWALDNNLAILANSNIHAPASVSYRNNRRPVTLVFATDKKEESIKKAMFEKRTAAFFGDTIIGDSRFLIPIFMNSIKVENYQGSLSNRTIKSVMIQNNSDITFYLRKRQPSIGFSSDDEIVLPAQRTVIIDIEGTSGEVSRIPVLRMFYEVKNLITLKNEPVPVNIDIPNR